MRKMKREEWLKQMGWRDIPFYPAGTQLPEECIVGFGEIKDRLLTSLSQEHNAYTFISGRYGYGKSTLLNWLEQEMLRQGSALIVRFRGPPTREEIVNRVRFMYEWRESPLHRLFNFLNPGPGLPLTIHDVPEFLNAVEKGKRKLFLVDEVETASGQMTREGLNELKRITDETGGALVMAGLPERAQKNIPESIIDRGMTAISLRPLTLDETHALVNTRVTIIAKGQTNPFSKDAVLTVHAKSGGIARQVNEICRQALLKNMEVGKLTVDASDIGAVQISAIAEGLPTEPAPKEDEAELLGEAVEVAGVAPRQVMPALKGTPYEVLTDLEKEIIQFIAENPACTAEGVAKGLHQNVRIVRVRIGGLLGQDETKKKPGIDYPVLTLSKEGRTNRYRLAISLNKLLGRT